MSATKACSKCLLTKKLFEFPRRPETADGRRAECRDCWNAYRRARYAAAPERPKAKQRQYREQHIAERRRYSREYMRKRRETTPHLQSGYMRQWAYGTDGAELYAAQDGKCAVCEASLAALPEKQRHLDHCHATGKVRGWLCHHCNTALGHMRDDPERLRAAAEYLERNR